MLKEGIDALGFKELEYAITQDNYKIFEKEGVKRTSLSITGLPEASLPIVMIVERILLAKDNRIFTWVKNQRTGKYTIMSIDHFEPCVARERTIEKRKYKEKIPAVRVFICSYNGIMKPVGNIGNILNSSHKTTFYECPECSNLIGV